MSILFGTFSPTGCGDSFPCQHTHLCTIASGGCLLSHARKGHNLNPPVVAFSFSMLTNIVLVNLHTGWVTFAFFSGTGWPEWRWREGPLLGGCRSPGCEVEFAGIASVCQLDLIKCGC